MYDAGIPPCNIMRSLANQVRGLDKLPYLKDDMKYHLHKYRKEQTKDRMRSTQRVEGMHRTIKIGIDPMINKCRAIGHTRCTCPKNANCKFAGKEPLADFDLNEVYRTSPQYSPTNSPEDIIGKNNSVLVREKLMSVMPNFYVDGEISNVVYTEEVENLDANPEIVDRFPKKDW
ncbi:hypothetical protein Cgig2_006606 [Carnegiea gigantea]|uniref:Uncharacterized protein n=1 Tax=Carnegiea gigantea TaxID=171969 RepID=A0A9Q1KP47_9CARY|nr:hypothetical protein Cgig2_006606 [Carnegiea gigantea]